MQRLLVLVLVIVIVIANSIVFVCRLPIARSPSDGMSASLPCDLRSVSNVITIACAPEAHPLDGIL
ncbi:MAG: hypothetical protein FJY92_04345 [Candidatus Hydrogenedentes bacterium]|nr:hypothetical protein [Candidatus Hydrogenedentota bacterium]